MPTPTETNNQPVEYIPLAKLAKSPLNVRKTATGCDDLIAGIRANGLMQNLSVYPGKKGNYLVFAGGRRLAALQALQNEGHFPADHAVACQVYTEDQAAELSLAENTIRVAMHPADRFIAFNALIEQGMTAEQVANRFGCTAKAVENTMRLARIAPALIQAYREEKLTFDALSAFAVTDDHAKQLAVYEALKDWQLDRPSEIRDALTEEMVQPDDKLAKFVGLDTYRAAGGVVIEDLAGDSFLENPELLDALVTEKLRLAEGGMKAEGWEWVQVDRDRDWQATQGCSRLTPGEVDPDAAEILDELEAAKVEQDRISAEYEESENDDLQERYEELDGTIERLNEQLKPYIRFTHEQKASAGCYAYIDRDGTLEIDRGLVRRQEGKKAAQKAAGATDDDKPVAKPKGIPESLKRDLEAYRLGVAQAEIAKHPAIAFDLLVFKASRSVLAMHPVNDGANITFSRNTGGAASKDACDFVRSRMGAIRETLALDWLEAGIEAEQFAAFQKLNGEQKHALLAFCVASTLQSKLVPEDGNLTAYDIALSQTGANVADYWRPTRENYLNRISREQLIAVAYEIYPASLRWSQRDKDAKKAVMVDKLHQTFAKSANPDTWDSIRNWLPEGMAFPKIEQPAAPEAKPAKAKKGKKAA